MRELWKNIESGSRSLTLEAETPAEAALTVVERALVNELLRSVADSSSGPRGSIAPTHCWVREYTGYGAFLNFREPLDAEQGERRTAPSHTRATVTLNWSDPSRSPLHAIMFFDGDCVTMVELVPMDDAGWEAAQCRSLFEAPLERVQIASLPARE